MRGPGLPLLLAARIGLVAIQLAGGCTSRDDRGGKAGRAGAAASVSIGAEEAERGRRACRSYVEQVCDCAVEKADLARECELARSRPGALDMNLRAAMAEGNATARDRAAILANARKIAAACIEDAAELAVRGCPIPEVTDSAAVPGSSAPAAGQASPAPRPPAEPAPGRSR